MQKMTRSPATPGPIGPPWWRRRELVTCARPRIKGTSAAAAAHAGAKMSKKYNIEFINVWTGLEGVHLFVPGPGASLQAFKQPDAGIEATSQGFKLQAWVYKLTNPGAGIKAEVPKLRGTGNKDKSIFFVLNVEWYLVRREPHKIGFFRGGYF